MKHIETSIPKESAEVRIARKFDAPAERVFDAFTRADLIPRWWGPKDYATTVDLLELRFGGRWRFVQTTKDGTVHPFRGVYHAVERPSLLIYTFEYEPQANHVILNTVAIESDGNGAIVTAQSVYPSIGERDAMVNAGMEWGERQSAERLEELLAAGFTALP